MAEMCGRAHPHDPRYLDKGTYVTLTVAVARSLYTPARVQQHTGPMRENMHTVAQSDANEWVNKQEEQCPGPRYDRYGRIVVVADYQDVVVSTDLLAAVREHNLIAMNISSGNARVRGMRGT